jgi:hypothetical protein
MYGRKSSELRRLCLNGNLSGQNVCTRAHDKRRRCRFGHVDGEPLSSAF